MYIISWVEIIFEGICGLKAADDRLYTFHMAVVQKLFHSRPLSAPPPGSIISMFGELVFPTLEELLSLSSDMCKAYFLTSPFILNLAILLLTISF